jgi:transcriptional regulator NrdR family protein
VFKVRVPHVRYETKRQTGEGTPAKIIRVDQEAVQFEKDKLEAMPNDPAQKKIVADAEKAIEAQIVKLSIQQAQGEEVQAATEARLPSYLLCDQSESA